MIDTSDLPDEVATFLTELSQHYEQFERIDRGANGFLVFAKNRVSGQDCAIKFYAGIEGERRHDEPRQLSALTCNNVLPILEARSISEEWAFFITPRSFEGDLDDTIEGTPSAHTAIDLAIGICAGVSSIHSAGMLHRDLKPGNIVILDGVPKIADFGSVVALESGTNDVAASRHSILWKPPESFETGRYSKKGDVYQIGLVLYQLLGGSLEYDGLSYLSKKEKIEYESIRNPIDQSIFVDSVIKRLVSTGKLMDLKSLPGWIDSRTRNALKQVCHPNPDRRLGSLGDVAAMLTSIRGRIKNWCWAGDIAVLEQGGSRIEVRPSRNQNEYVAYKDSGSGFRRIPRSPIGSLAGVTSKI